MNEPPPPSAPLTAQPSDDSRGNERRIDKVTPEEKIDGVPSRLCIGHRRESGRALVHNAGREWQPVIASAANDRIVRAYTGRHAARDEPQRNSKDGRRPETPATEMKHAEKQCAQADAGDFVENLACDDRNRPRQEEEHHMTKNQRTGNARHAANHAAGSSTWLRTRQLRFIFPFRPFL